MSLHLEAVILHVHGMVLTQSKLFRHEQRGCVEKK